MENPTESYGAVMGIENPIMIEYKDKYFELDNDTVIPAEKLLEYEAKIKAKWDLLAKHSN